MKIPLHLILIYFLCRIHPRPTMSDEVFCEELDKMYLLRQLFTLTTNFNYTSVCFSKNRIYICKNIIQSIKDYIITPEKLEVSFDAV